MTKETVKEFLMQISINRPDEINSRWRPDILCEMIDIISGDLKCKNCIHYFSKAKQCTRNVEFERNGVYEDFACIFWKPITKK